MKQTLKKINWIGVIEVILASVLILSPLVVSAQFGANVQCQGTGLNCSNGDVNSFIKTIINWLLAIAFGVAVLFLIIGGFWYIASAGNEETAEKGKNTAINAIIGIVIILLSYVIVNVVSKLVTSSGNSGA